VIKILVVDDQRLVRAGFWVLVESAPDLEVVGEAGDGAEAVKLARRELPDVVLMDIRMPRMDGLEATRRIVALDQAGGVRVLVLTTFDLDEYVYEALRQARAASWSKTYPRTTCWPPSGSWPPGTRCSPQHHPAPDRRVRPPARAEPGHPGRPGLTDRPGAGGTGPGGQGPVQRRDRRPAGGERGHGQDPRQPGPGQAPGPRPGPAGDAGLRDGPDHPGPAAAPARSVGVPTFREETRHDGDQGAELSKRFGDVLAVDQLDFEIDQETVAGFLGPNGAGKTTTLRMLLGLVAPTAGTATPTFLIIPRRGRWRRPSWPRPASPACPWARPRR